MFVRPVTLAAYSEEIQNVFSEKLEHWVTSWYSELTFWFCQGLQNHMLDKGTYSSAMPERLLVWMTPSCANSRFCALWSVLKNKQAIPVSSSTDSRSTMMFELDLCEEWWRHSSLSALLDKSEAFSFLGDYQNNIHCPPLWSSVIRNQTMYEFTNSTTVLRGIPQLCEGWLNSSHWLGG